MDEIVEQEDSVTDKLHKLIDAAADPKTDVVCVVVGAENGVLCMSDLGLQPQHAIGLLQAGIDIIIRQLQNEEEVRQAMYQRSLTPAKEIH